MTVMNEDHPDVKYWRKMAPLFKEAELPEDHEPTGTWRAAIFRMTNEHRRQNGLPELVNDEDEFPEIGLHRCAVARGMAHGVIRVS